MNTPSTPETSASADQTRWFATEVHPHDNSLKAYLRSSFPGIRDVEDVVQESYSRILRLRTTRTIHSAKALLFTLARHVALDRVRRERVSPVAAVADLSVLPAVEEGHPAPTLLENEEKARLLAKALAALPDRTREVVVLRKFEGISQREVAARLGLSEAAVEHQVSRGLKRCEAHLRKLGIQSLY